MVKKTDIGWRLVENSLSKRMIDNSLVHLFDKSHKSISKKTQFINKELSKFHVIKDYDQYVKLKTRALRKFDGLDVSDSSDDEKDIYTRRIINARRKNVQKNCKKKKSNEVTVMNKRKTKLSNVINKSDNALQSNESDVDLTDVNNSDLSISNDVDDDSSTVVNNSRKNSINEDLNNKEYSTVNSIDKNKKIEDHTIDNSSVEDQSIEDHIVENPSVDQNVEDQTTQDSSFEDYSIEDQSDEDQTIDDYSGEDLTDEDQKIEDYSIEDITDQNQHIGVSKLIEVFPENGGNNKFIKDDSSVIFKSQKNDIVDQKKKSVLKITSTEVVRPKFTIVIDSQSNSNVMNNSLKNQITSEELFDDNNKEDIVFRETNQNKIMTGDEAFNEDRISLMKQTYNLSSENEELESNLNNISNYINRVDNHTEASKNSIRKNRKVSNESDEAYDENVIEEVMEANEIDNVLTCSSPNNRDALGYILQQMSRWKTPEKQHLFDMNYLNEHCINLRNESTDDLMLNDDSSSQSDISYERPTTLNEFVQVNNLVPMENKPSTITLDDLSDNDEFFEMEIPKSVIDQQQLIGKRMEIKKKSIIIGDTKYKLHRKKNKTLTCIFRENNEEMSFKTVNIEPKGSFVVRQRLSPRIMKSCSHKIVNDNNTRAPFPKNLKTRNPLENNNKKLKRYEEKIINDHENIYRKTKLKLER